MSANTPADRLLQSIKVRAPGATDQVVTLELFNAIDEFLRRTMAWREVFPITLTENLQYDLGVPAGSTIVRVISVLHNGIPIAAVSAGGTSQSSLGTLLPELTFPDGDASFLPVQTDMVGGIFSYAIYQPEFITVTTPPSESQQQFPLVVTLALSISSDSLELDAGDWQLPDWMYEMFFQDWLDGALLKLCSMQAKPWGNKDMVIYHGKRWRSAMATRKQEANRGFVYGQPGWRFRRW